MNKKDFDITQHEWFDGDFSVENLNEEIVEISVEYIDWSWHETERVRAILSRQDVIALAKAINLTAEDLEG